MCRFLRVCTFFSLVIWHACVWALVLSSHTLGHKRARDVRSLQPIHSFTHTHTSSHGTKQIGNNIELNNNVGKNNILNYIIAFLLQMIGYQFFWVRFNYFNWESRKSFADCVAVVTHNQPVDLILALSFTFFSSSLSWSCVCDRWLAGFFVMFVHSFAWQVIICSDKSNVDTFKCMNIFLI